MALHKAASHNPSTKNDLSLLMPLAILLVGPLPSLRQLPLANNITPVEEDDMLPLSAADKKLLKQIISSPWPGELPPPFAGSMEAASDEQLHKVTYSYASLEDLLRAAVEQYRRSAAQQIANVARLQPGMSQTQLRDWLADACLTLDDRGDTVAIARRLLADDPEELIRFRVVSTRMCWVMSGHGREDCASLWDAVLTALALGDKLALERFLSTLPPLLDKDPPYGFSPHYNWLYNAALALVRGDLEAARPFVKKLRWARLPKNEDAIVTCLRGIVDASPQLVAEGLQARAASIRKVKTLDPHFKLVDEKLHYLYQLCQRIDPGLTKLWDAGHALPWDAGYHERLQAGGDPMHTVDLSGLPERERTLLLELPVPDWWSAIASPTVTEAPPVFQSFIELP